MIPPISKHVIFPFTSWSCAILSPQGQCPSPLRSWQFKMTKWTKMIALLLHLRFSLNLEPRCLGYHPARRYLSFWLCSLNIQVLLGLGSLYKCFTPSRWPFRLCCKEWLLALLTTSWNQELILKTALIWRWKALRRCEPYRVLDMQLDTI